MVICIKERTVVSLAIEASLVHSCSYIIKDDSFQSKSDFRLFCQLFVTSLAYFEVNFYQNLHFRLNSYNFDHEFNKLLKSFDDIVKNLFVGLNKLGKKT